MRKHTYILSDHDMAPPVAGLLLVGHGRLCLQVSNTIHVHIPGTRICPVHMEYPAPKYGVHMEYFAPSNLCQPTYVTVLQPF